MCKNLHIWWRGRVLERCGGVTQVIQLKAVRGEVQIFAHLMAKVERGLACHGSGLRGVCRASGAREFSRLPHPALPGWASFYWAWFLDEARCRVRRLRLAFHKKAKRRRAAALQSRAEALHYMRKSGRIREGGGGGPGTGDCGGWTGRRCRGRRRPGGRGLRGSRGCGGGRAWPGGSGRWGGGRPV